MDDEAKGKLKKEWSNRETVLKLVTIFIGFKEVLDLLVNFIAILPGGIVITGVWNIVMGFLVTIALAFTSFRTGFSNKKALIKKIVRLVVGFLGEMALSFLPLDLITILWIWYDEKKEYETRISGRQKKTGGKFSSLVNKAGNMDRKNITGIAGAIMSGPSGIANYAASRVAYKAADKVAGKIEAKRNLKNIESPRQDTGNKAA